MARGSIVSLGLSILFDALTILYVITLLVSSLVGSKPVSWEESRRRARLAVEIAASIRVRLVRVSQLLQAC